MRGYWDEIWGRNKWNITMTSGMLDPDDMGCVINLIEIFWCLKTGLQHIFGTALPQHPRRGVGPLRGHSGIRSRIQWLIFILWKIRHQPAPHKLFLGRASRVPVYRQLCIDQPWSGSICGESFVGETQPDRVRSTTLSDGISRHARRNAAPDAKKLRWKRAITVLVAKLLN